MTRADVYLLCFAVALLSSCGYSTYKEIKATQQIQLEIQQQQKQIQQQQRP